MKTNKIKLSEMGTTGLIEWAREAQTRRGMRLRVGTVKKIVFRRYGYSERLSGRIEAACYDGKSRKY